MTPQCSMSCDQQVFYYQIITLASGGPNRRRHHKYTGMRLILNSRFPSRLWRLQVSSVCPSVGQQRGGGGGQHQE